MTNVLPFRLTLVVWKEVTDKALEGSRALEKLLLENLRLDTYGDDIEELTFVFIIVLPTNINHTEYKRFARKKKQLEMRMKLNYETFLAATPEDVKTMMANLFLNSILLYKKMRMKNFDHQRFYADVKSLFEKNGLLREESVGNEVGK